MSAGKPRWHSGAADAELLATFTRLVEADGVHELQVGVVHWDVHEPYLVWKCGRRWKRIPSPERLASAQRSVLNTPRFFRTCRECGVRNNAGHMGQDCCHTCMEHVYGVVF